MPASVGIEFKAFFTVKKEGDWYIAHCPPLDVTSQGKTLTEARSNIVEACQLFLISCLERGTLDRALLELGWFKQPRRVPPQAEHFSVPISARLLAGMQRECHA